MISVRPSSHVPKKQKRSHIPVPEITPSSKPAGLKPGWRATINASGTSTTRSTTRSQPMTSNSDLTSATLKAPSTYGQNNRKIAYRQLGTSDVAKYGGFVSDSASDISADNRKVRKIAIKGTSVASIKAGLQEKRTNNSGVKLVCCNYTCLSCSQVSQIAICAALIF
jgi:hypothetical protein